MALAVTNWEIFPEVFGLRISAEVPPEVLMTLLTGGLYFTCENSGSGGQS